MCIAMRGKGEGFKVYSTLFVNKLVDTGEQTFETHYLKLNKLLLKYLNLIIDCGVRLPILEKSRLQASNIFWEDFWLKMLTL
jgi:hypothetical protein